MKPTKNLPALNDNELRKLNTKKVIGAIESIGKCAKFFKYKVVMDILILCGFFLFLFLVVVGGFKYIDYKSEGGFLSSLYDLEHATQRYSCHNSETKFTFKLPEEALAFKELFPNATCIYYSIKKWDQQLTLLYWL